MRTKKDRESETIQLPTMIKFTHLRWIKSKAPQKTPGGKKRKSTTDKNTRGKKKKQATKKRNGIIPIPLDSEDSDSKQDDVWEKDVLLYGYPSNNLESATSSQKSADEYVLVFSRGNEKAPEISIDDTRLQKPEELFSTTGFEIHGYSADTLKQNHPLLFKHLQERPFWSVIENHSYSYGPIVAKKIWHLKEGETGQEKVNYALRLLSPDILPASNQVGGDLFYEDVGSVPDHLQSESCWGHRITGYSKAKQRHFTIFTNPLNGYQLSKNRPEHDTLVDQWMPVCVEAVLYDTNLFSPNDLTEVTIKILEFSQKPGGQQLTKVPDFLEKKIFLPKTEHRLLHEVEKSEPDFSEDLNGLLSRIKRVVGEMQDNDSEDEDPLEGNVWVIRQEQFHPSSPEVIYVCYKLAQETMTVFDPRDDVIGWRSLNISEQRKKNYVNFTLFMVFRPVQDIEI